MGIAFGDIENDGDLDIYVSNGGSPNSLYQNNGDGTFTNIAASVGVADGQDGQGVTFGDYDNDDDLDLYMKKRFGANNRLYQNNGSGIFTDVAVSAGVADGSGDSHGGVAFGDYDGDGDLDIYGTNFGSANRLYRNNGDGTFIEVGGAAGVNDAGQGAGVSWGDYDNDGDLDLYLANDGGANRLYRNNGDGTFTDVASSAGVADAGPARGVSWGDYDNDGDLDLYVTNRNSANQLYRNNGNGTFAEIGAAAGVDDTGHGVGMTWGDYDNDGHLDLYVANFGSANRLYRNNGDGTFTDVGGAASVADTGSGLGAASGDYDSDGDLDIYLTKSFSANRLYRNNQNDPNFLFVRPLDAAGRFNRHGAIVRVFQAGTSILAGTRTIDGGNAYRSQNAYDAHFGLPATGTYDIQVTFPRGNVVSSANVSPTSLGPGHLVTVNDANHLPTISDISDQTTDENTATPALPFTVGDAETDLASLTLTKSADDQTLVPDANIVLGGTDANRTVTVTPALNQFGTATITVAVDDGVATTSDTFLLTVNALNNPPTISNIADQSIGEDTPTAAIAFTIGDVETAASSLTLTGTSSDTTLVPTANIVFGGADANRTVTVTPALNQFGTATITVTVDDGVATTSDPFLLTVNAVNDPPTISDIADQSTGEDTSTAAIVFTIGDVETEVSSLTLTGTSSDTTLVPNANIVFGGTDANRTVTVTPAGDEAGSTTITVSVSDGTDTANDTFVLTVNMINDPPTMSDILDQTTDQNVPTTVIAFAIGDLETAAASLTLTGSSSDTTLVPNANIVFGGADTSRTATITPALNKAGTATITVTVSDGTNTTSDTFVLTVNPKPTIDVDPSPISFGDVIVAEPTPLTVTIGNLGTANLTVTSITPAPGAILAVSGFSIPFTITPGGADQEMTLTLTASTPGTVSGTLTIVNDDPNSPTTVNITAEAKVFTFTLDLSSGLNMISMPLKPLNPLKAADFATLLVDATLVIRYDTTAGKFKSFVVGVTSTTSPDNFDIDPEHAYIVNMSTAGMIQIQGTPWGTPAAPAATGPGIEKSGDTQYTVRDPQGATGGDKWAFVVPGVLYDQEAPAQITVRSERTHRFATYAVSDGNYTPLLIDLNRQPVVEVGDSLEITAYDNGGARVSGPFKLDVTPEHLAHAYLKTDLRWGDIIPDFTRLRQNYPNPFNPETWLPYELVEPAEVVITIYDVNGAIVRSLTLGHQAAGLYIDRSKAAHWDGRNAAGERVGSGVYFYHFCTGSYQATRKMLILK